MELNSTYQKAGSYKGCGQTRMRKGCRAHIQRKVVVRDDAVMASTVRAKTRFLNGIVTVSSCYFNLSLIYCIINNCGQFHPAESWFTHRVGIVPSRSESLAISTCKHRKYFCDSQKIVVRWHHALTR